MNAGSKSDEKCFFFQKKVKFLGHIVSENGLETDPDKINKVKDWPIPTNSNELIFGICRLISSIREKLL